MQEITLNLTLDETNLVLEGLGHLPFAKVYALVGKIQSQAGAQINPPRPVATAGSGNPAGTEG